MLCSFSRFIAFTRTRRNVIVELGPSAGDRRVLLECPVGAEWPANALPLLDEHVDESIADDSANAPDALCGGAQNSSSIAHQSLRSTAIAATTATASAAGDRAATLRAMRVRQVALERLPGGNLLAKLCALFTALSYV